MHAPRHIVGGRARRVLAIGALVALITAPGAFAHASLTATTPPNDAVLESAPAEVTLRFSEPVETSFGSVRVYDGAARRVDDGRRIKPRPDEVGVGLARELPGGTYTVAWRVVSGDSHPIRGAFVFHVGAPGGDPGGVASEVLGSTEGSTTVGQALGVVRFVGLVLLLLTAGTAAALSLWLGGAVARSRRIAWWLVAVGSALLVPVALVGLWLQAASAAGLGLEPSLRWQLLREVAGTRFGEASLLRIAAAVALAVLAVAVLARRRLDGRVVSNAAILLALPLVVTPALAGHARVRGGLAVAIDSTHVGAAAAWVGGLAVLVTIALGPGASRREQTAALLPRFSQVAVVAVGLLVLAGALRGLAEVDLDDLWSTTYGRILLAKVAVAVGMIGLGGLNRRRVRADPERSAVSPDGRRGFLATAGVELALGLVAIGLTAVLVAEPPPGAGATEGPASIDTTVGPYGLNLVVDPARQGRNEIHAYLLDRAGQPAAVDEVRIAASLPAAAVGPLALDPVPAGPGHVVVPGASLPLAGTWTLMVAVRKGEFDQWSTTLPIVIRKDKSP